MVATLLMTVMLTQAAEPLRVAWNRTPEAFAGKSVTVQLASGTKIRGTWIDVTPATFTMNVSNSSKRTAVPKGVQVLQRSAISRVRLQRCRARGRVFGTLAGFFGTTLAAIGVNEALNPGDPPIGVGLIGIAGGFAGYWIGNYFDQRATQEVLFIN